MAYKSLVIQPLNKSHKKSDFRCGESSLDIYLKKQASQDVKRRISRVFVAVEPTKPDVILGFYSLSSLSIELNLEKSVDRTFIAQSLDAPSKFKNLLITNKVTAHFLNSLCTSRVYTLNALSTDLSRLKDLPSDLVKKLPKVPVPAALIGRLAVSKQAQGYGIGKMLLVDGIKRTLSVSQQIAIYAMVVDVISEDVSHFYQQFGFMGLNAGGSRLFLPLKSSG